jgi:hypothetical protein
MDVARRRAASTAFSLAVLVLVIVFGVVGLLVSHTAISSVQAEAVKAAERAAEAGREKLTAYIWKNVTSTGNITMLTLENRGGVGLSIDRAVAYRVWWPSPLRESSRQPDISGGWGAEDDEAGHYIPRIHYI